MLRAYHAVLALVLLGGVTGVHAADKPPVITGAGAHFSWVVFDELKPRLEKATGREITLFGREAMLGAGCNAGIKSAMQHGNGMETFGFVCCPLTEQEIRKNRLQVFPLALEPVLILVNEDNPVNALSSDQARKIFRGEITNWQEVGGKDEAIVVVTRLHCKKRPGHWKTLLRTPGEFTSQRLNVQSAADMVTRLNDFKTAVGHTGAVWKFNDKDRVKALKIDGYAPSSKNLRAGHYPFYRVLSAVASDMASDDVVKILTLSQQYLHEGDLADRLSIVPITEMPANQIP
ncbi:MAG: substrate-binding domain-containing protein [Granulosicoccaceae bacterium]|jgi:ABC-type phosphate transport system substrate-binding protein